MDENARENKERYKGGYKMIVAKIDPCTCNCREINIHREELDGQLIAHLEDAVDQMDDVLAEIVLKGLRDYSQEYSQYKYDKITIVGKALLNGKGRTVSREFNQSPTVEEVDALLQITILLAEKLGIKETE